MHKITESDSNYTRLEHMSIQERLLSINALDHEVAPAVKKVIPQITPLVEHIVSQMTRGGRLIYMGAGTSGRLGILDASECPPTFGVPDDWVMGLIAGGDGAIRKAVEFAEDSQTLGWEDLLAIDVCEYDTVLGIAASGTTPYVVHALKKCCEKGITTACITCNIGTPLAEQADHPIEVIVGPEFVTGSTRMKSGTAQKMVLNMISTSVMIGLGRVKGNKMVDMQLANNKLVERGIVMLTNELSISKEKACELLKTFGSVRKSVEQYNK